MRSLQASLKLDTDFIDTEGMKGNLTQIGNELFICSMAVRCIENPATVLAAFYLL